MKKAFFINLPMLRLMHDTEYLAMTYCKKIHNYLCINEGGILNTKRRLLYLKTQFVPRSKHFSSRL